MAEQIKTDEVKENKGMNSDKSTEKNVAQNSKPTEAPTNNDIDQVINVLNELDMLSGGKGTIKQLPPELLGSVKYLIDKMTAVKEAFADPLFVSLIDDMVDQHEDGQIPSVEVAVVRNIPIEKLQDLADTEEYGNTQMELANNLASQKTKEEEDSILDQNFASSQAAGDEYAAEMGYSSDEKNALFKFMMDMYSIIGDGKLTKKEWKDVDNMRNFDKITGDLQSQIRSQEDAKVVLPDQSSIEAAKSSTQNMNRPRQNNTNVPGLSSLGNGNPYQNVSTDYTNRRR